MPCSRTSFKIASSSPIGWLDLVSSRTFLLQIIWESRTYGQQIGWFTSLFSQKDNVEPLGQALEKRGRTLQPVVPEEYRAASGRVVGGLSVPEGQEVQLQNH